MHVGNNSSSEAKHHVTERAQNSRVENKPPGARGSRGTLEEAGHQLPGDISCAPPPRFTAQGALCHPVAGAADPRCRGLTYETMPRRLLCIRHGHTGSRNEGIRSPTCPSTGLPPHQPSVISSRDSGTRSSRRSRNPTVPMTHRKSYQDAAWPQFSLQIQKTNPLVEATAPSPAIPEDKRFTGTLEVIGKLSPRKAPIDPFHIRGKR